MRLELSCPAKLNLFLSVGPSDQRGFHPLRTVFQAVDLSDRMVIDTCYGEHEVTFDDPAIPKDNTVTRALRLLAEVADLPSLQVKIEKRIPTQSGLGGGSSNAGGLLRAVIELLKLPIPRGELHGLAQTLGADVPFFLVGGRARAEGYGEKLTPLADTTPKFFAIARPNVNCPTPEMFKRLDELNYPWREFPRDDETYNDFERVAPPESLDLIEFLLQAGASAAGLTGSGSAVFGRFGNGNAASSAALNMARIEGCRSWAAKSLSRAESLSVHRE